MANDGLNQVGKSLHKQGKDANYALGRYAQNFPQIEAVRDSFSSNDPYITYFTIEAGAVGKVSTTLDLSVISGPDAPCKQFDASTTTLNLGHSYVPTQIQVYQNDTLLTITTEYLESDPTHGIVTLLVTPDSADKFYICQTSPSTSGVLGIDLLVWNGNVSASLGDLKNISWPIVIGPNEYLICIAQWQPSLSATGTYPEIQQTSFFLSADGYATSSQAQPVHIATAENNGERITQTEYLVNDDTSGRPLTALTPGPQVLSWDGGGYAAEFTGYVIHVSADVNPIYNTD